MGTSLTCRNVDYESAFEVYADGPRILADFDQGPNIVLDKAQAIVGGKQAFAARDRLPATVMPKRSYKRSSLAEIRVGLRKELTGALSYKLIGASQL
jgi:hypothetical protein